MDWLDSQLVDVGIAAACFIALFLLAELVFVRLRGQKSSRRRLQAGVAAANQQALLRRRPARAGTAALPELERLLLQSGLGWSQSHFFLIALSAGALVAAAITLSLDEAAIAILVGAVAGPALPLLLLVYLRRQRQSRLENQLPEALDTIVRSLRAGHPIAASIALLLKDMPEPIGQEFEIVANELAYGLDLQTALAGMCDRVGLDDLNIVAIAVNIQSRSGGNLAEILESISRLVRERTRMRMKVGALSAEARLSANAMSLLPFIVFGLLWFVAPGFYGDIWDTWYVRPLLVVGIAWVAIGNIIMQTMVNFRI